MDNNTNLLEKIVFRKMSEIAIARENHPLETLQKQCQIKLTKRGFLQKISEQYQQQKLAIIAEIKKASPSKGILREDFDPIAIAKSYEQYGATCLSVLTDETFFQGNLEDLVKVRTSVQLPILRKDFIIDPYQIYQSAALGADCILLIASIITKAQLEKFTAIAKELSLDILYEVHDRNDLDKILSLKPALIGINNRDLKTFKTDIKNTLNLASLIPAETLIISESGIETKEDMQLLIKNDIYGALIGETFMRAVNPGIKLQELISVSV